MPTSATAARCTGDCVTCPYHGWEWGPDGVNVSIPYQDTPNRSKRLRVWPVDEQYGSVYLWHHPDGEPPSWPMPDIFLSFPQFETDPAAYYEPITAKAEREPVHPQVVAENGPDSVHFALRAPRHGHAGRARLGARRPDLEVPHRLAQHPQRRPRRDDRCGSTAGWSASAVRSPRSRASSSTG